MNVLILEASGFLGGHIYKKIKSQLDFNLLGTCYGSNNCGDLIKLDVTNEEEVKRHVKENNRPKILGYFLSDKELGSAHSRAMGRF